MAKTNRKPKTVEDKVLQRFVFAFLCFSPSRKVTRLNHFCADLLISSIAKPNVRIIVSFLIERFIDFSHAKLGLYSCANDFVLVICFCIYLGMQSSMTKFHSNTTSKLVCGLIQTLHTSILHSMT